MTRCGCPDTALACVRIGDGIVLLRCGAHDVQRWSFHGRPVDRAAALALLTDAFAAQPRPVPAPRRVPPVVRPPRVVRLPKPVVDRRAGIDEQLTALLRARGLEGSWVIA